MIYIYIIVLVTRIMIITIMIYNNMIYSLFGGFRNWGRTLIYRWLIMEKPEIRKQHG